MTTIQELERRIAAGEMMADIARSTGVTRRCVSARIRRSKATQDFIASLTPGEMLRETRTGHRWQYMGPSARSADSVRVATEGGAHQMDMRVSDLARIPKIEPKTEENRDLYSAVLFSVSRGDNPNDPRFQRYIDRALEVRKRLDQEKQKPQKPDPDANLRATVAKKTASRKNKTE